MWTLPLLIVITTVVLSVPVRVLPRLDRRRPLPRVRVGCSGSNRGSTRARRAGSSTPFRCCCLTRCCSRSAFSCWRCSLICPLHRRAKGCWHRRRSSTRPVRFSRTPTCRITRANSTCRTSARFSSSWPTCSSRPAWAFALWPPSSAACAATHTWEIFTSTCGGSSPMSSFPPAS